MKKKILLLGLAALLLYLMSVENVSASTLVYDDFNDGTLGTNTGGAAGAMSPGGLYDPTISFASGVNAYEGAYALSIQYDFPSGQWCGYWSFFYPDESGYDLSGYVALEMWVKGASGGENFKVELKDTANNMNAVRITTIAGFSGGLTTEWQKLYIPLTKFSGVNLTNVKQMNIVFDQAPRSGTVYIDLIQFTTEEPSNQPPNASFIYSPSSPTIDNVIQFTDQSTDSDGNIVSWAWDFGDEGTSTLQNPTHRYYSAGTYSVTLTVTDNDGLTGTTSGNVIVIPRKVADNLGGDIFVYDDFNDELLDTNMGGVVGPMSPKGAYDPTVNFTSAAAEGAYALSLSYDFPSGQWCGYWSYANDEDPDSPPEKTIDVSSYNELRMQVKGTLGDEQFKIELKSGMYEASFYYLTNLGTIWKEVRISLSDFQKVLWEPNPVDLTRLQQLNIVFDRPPRQSTVYIDNIQFARAEIIPQAPIADFNYTPSIPNVGDTINFDASSSTDPDGTIVSYSWSFGDGDFDTGMIVSHTYTTEGNYTVTLTVTDNSGLTDTKFLSITVSVEPPPGPSDNETSGGGGLQNTVLIIGTAIVVVLGVITATILIKGRGYPEAGWRVERRTASEW